MTTTTTEPGQALAVLDRTTGEVLEVNAAETDQLVGFVVNLDELRAGLAEAEQIVLDEMLERLDRSGNWTHRVATANGRHYEIKAPSPEAGTTGYDPLVLERELDDLVDAREIDRRAAEAALERTVTITYRLPWGTSYEDLLADLRTLPIPGEASALERKPRPAGINALVKIGGKAKRAAARARVRTPAPKRKPKVKEVAR